MKAFNNFKLTSAVKTLHHTVTAITVLQAISLVKGVILFPSEYKQA